jgi:hypothetical protein
LGNAVTNNTSVEKDAMEVTDNTVARNLICFGNSPTVHIGDSGVGRTR